MIGRVGWEWLVRGWDRAGLGENRGWGDCDQLIVMDQDMNKWGFIIDLDGGRADFYFGES